MDEAELRLGAGTGRTGSSPTLDEKRTKSENPRMPPGPAHARSSPAQIEALLADLGPRLGRGGALRPTPPLHASGLAAIDALLGGGFPGGGVSEIVGPPSSGRTSVALALLARTTRPPDATGRTNHAKNASLGALAAWIDRADSFDPVSAEAAGVNLENVLWVRAGNWREALRCGERLLETEGLPLIVLDLASPLPATRPTRPTRKEEAIPQSAWIRLARKAAGTPALLLVLSDHTRVGPQATVALAMQPSRARFSQTPILLEELEARAVLVRHRAIPERMHTEASIGLGASAASRPGSS